jgi:hypothetical protein
MKSFFPTTLILFCLLIGCAIGVSAQTKQNEGPLTNAEVVKLVKAGFKEKTIVLIIAARAPNFDLTPDKMIQLKRNGVGENIIVAMLARQDGGEVAIDDSSSSWADDPFNDNKKSSSGNSPGSDGATGDIFGSSSGSKSSTKSRGGVSGSSSGESNLSGSATVRILRPPSEAGGNTGAAKLERAKSLTNDSIVELVEAGFSEGTIIRRIEQSPVDFDLADEKLNELRKRRVSDKVLAAMKAAMGEDK